MGALGLGLVNQLNQERQLRNQTDQIRAHSELLKEQTKAAKLSNQMHEQQMLLQGQFMQPGEGVPVQGEVQGPGAPQPVTVPGSGGQPLTPGTGFSPEQLAQPVSTQPGGMQQALQQAFQQRSPAFFQEGARPQRQQALSPFEQMTMGMPPQAKAFFAFAYRMNPEGTMQLLGQHALPQTKFIPLKQGEQLAKETIGPTGSTVEMTGLGVPAKPESPKGVDMENAVAMELYGKPFAELDQTQQGKVNARVKQDKVEVAEAQAGATTAARMREQDKKRLTPSEAADLAVPYGTTQGEALGRQPINPHQRETLASFDQARSILDDIEQYAEKVPDVEPGVMGRVFGGGKNYMNAILQTDENAALLMSKAGELSQVARAMGERGTLATGDIARAAGLIPLVTDTKAVRRKKMADLRTFFDKGESAFRKSLGPGGGTSPKRAPAAPAPQAAPPQGKWTPKDEKRLKELEQKAK